jgi:hypothetical protein
VIKRQPSAPEDCIITTALVDQGERREEPFEDTPFRCFHRCQKHSRQSVEAERAGVEAGKGQTEAVAITASSAT